MEESVRKMHLRAALFYGRTASCGDGILKPRKQDYRSEERAERSARELSARLGKTLEGYPCPFCRGWHIGRRMTPEEVDRFVDPRPCAHVLHLASYVDAPEYCDLDAEPGSEYCAVHAAHNVEEVRSGEDT